MYFDVNSIYVPHPTNKILRTLKQYINRFFDYLKKCVGITDDVMMSIKYYGFSTACYFPVF